MPKAAAQPVPFRSFTVRIPETLYEKIGDLAQDDGVYVNVKVNQLLKLGLGEHISLDAAVARMLKKEVVQ